ncbi:MAG: aldo/keto reductase [Planctomycetes bacterium]|nr:aldo/keto reductase [Planctomycetota bacterium]
MKELRPLGRTGIRVTPIGLGLWQFSKRANLAGKFWPELADDETDAIVRAALDGGVNWFDTAEIYGKGRSEEALARGLSKAGKRDGDVVIATKWWPTFRRAGNIRKTIGERIGRLGGFSIDLHQVHHPASLSSVRAQMDAMADLVSQEKIRAVGVSNFGARRMRAAHAALAKRGLPLAANQVKMSLLCRKPEQSGVLAAAKELGITVIAYSPLAQGLLSGRFHDDPALVKRSPGFRRFLPSFRRKGLARSRPVVEALRAIAAAHGATPSQVALAWLVAFHGDTVVAIPGATKPGQASECAAAMTIELTPAELVRLDEVSRAFV